MIVLVTGSRWGDKYTTSAAKDAFDRAMRELATHGVKPTLIIDGDCPNSPDHVAKWWAQTRAIPRQGKAADWDNLDVPGAKKRKNAAGKLYNANAGFARNTEMAVQVKEQSDKYGGAVCLAMHDGNSKGTMDMVKKALQHEIPVYYCVVDYYNRKMNCRWLKTVEDLNL